MKPALTCTPLALPEMTFRAPAVVPPIVLYFAAQKYFVRGIEQTLK